MDEEFDSRTVSDWPVAGNYGSPMNVWQIALVCDWCPSVSKLCPNEFADDVVSYNPKHVTYTTTTSCTAWISDVQGLDHDIWYR